MKIDIGEVFIKVLEIMILLKVFCLLLDKYYGLMNIE